MVAPLALSVAELPLQMVCELAVRTGAGKMVTVAVVGATAHGPPLPVIVYTVVLTGLATTELPLVEERPVAGVQL